MPEEIQRPANIEYVDLLDLCRRTGLRRFDEEIYRQAAEAARGK